MAKRPARNPALVSVEVLKPVGELPPYDVMKAAQNALDAFVISVSADVPGFAARLLEKTRREVFDAVPPAEAPSRLVKLLTREDFGCRREVVAELVAEITGDPALPEKVKKAFRAANGDEPKHVTLARGHVVCSTGKDFSTAGPVGLVTWVNRSDPDDPGVWVTARDGWELPDPLELEVSRLRLPTQEEAEAFVRGLLESRPGALAACLRAAQA